MDMTRIKYRFEQSTGMPETMVQDTQKSMAPN